MRLQLPVISAPLGTLLLTSKQTSEVQWRSWPTTNALVQSCFGRASSAKWWPMVTTFVEISQNKIIICVQQNKKQQHKCQHLGLLLLQAFLHCCEISRPPHLRIGISPRLVHNSINTITLSNWCILNVWTQLCCFKESGSACLSETYTHTLQMKDLIQSGIVRVAHTSNSAILSWQGFRLEKGHIL